METNGDNQDADQIVACLQQIVAVTQQFVEAISAAWDMIVEHVAGVVATVARWYWREIHPVLARYGLIPITRSTMMQRKLRRYALLVARRS